MLAIIRQETIGADHQLRVIPSLGCGDIGLCSYSIRQRLTLSITLAAAQGVIQFRVPTVAVWCS